MDGSYTLGSFSTGRFWATEGNQKWAVIQLNLSSHYHIYVVVSKKEYYCELQ